MLHRMRRRKRGYLRFYEWGQKTRGGEKYAVLPAKIIKPIVVSIYIEV